jgi:hypothetical protein
MRLLKKAHKVYQCYHGETRHNQGRKQSPPHQPIDHFLSLEVQSTSRTAARVGFELITTITTCESHTVHSSYGFAGRPFFDYSTQPIMRPF